MLRQSVPKYSSKVLTKPNHLQHAVYTRINQRFHELGVNSGDDFQKRINDQVLASFYQLLLIPGAWILAVTFDITAAMPCTAHSFGLYTIRRPAKDRPQME